MVMKGHDDKSTATVNEVAKKERTSGVKTYAGLVEEMKHVVEDKESCFLCYLSHSAVSHRSLDEACTDRSRLRRSLCTPHKTSVLLTHSNWFHSFQVLMRSLPESWSGRLFMVEHMSAFVSPGKPS